MKSKIIALIQSALNKNVSVISSLSGGSIASSYKAECDDGSFLFVKVSPQHNDMFVKEANGLKELRKSNSIRIPEVLFASEELLILEFLFSSAPAHRSNFFGKFGRQFAQLHRTTSDQFGYGENNYIGSTLQLNLPKRSSWKEFFFLHRLEFQVRLAEQNGYNDREIIAQCHRLEKIIDRLIPDDGEPPALLHGDLWSGNFLCVDDQIPVLIDPAVYYGHREADLAMTTLFGGFSEAFYESYNEVYPLNEEWERRMELYTLYHLLNHLNLFGEGYYAQLYGTLKSLLR